MTIEDILAWGKCGECGQLVWLMKQDAQYGVMCSEGHCVIRPGGIKDPGPWDENVTEAEVLLAQAEYE